jgi:hypothetical protein
MCEISCLFERENIVESEDPEYLSVSDIVFYKNVRLVSGEVEHSFSQHKPIFHDNWQRFMTHNLQTTLVVHCNSAQIQFEILMTFGKYFV